MATVQADERNGDFKWSGDAPAVALATRIMHENGWTRGHFLQDELFVTRRVVKLLGDSEVIDTDAVVTSLRDGWVRLLRDNLMPDPAAQYGEHLDRVVAWNGLTCEIESRGERLSLKYGPARTGTRSIHIVRASDPLFIHCDDLRIRWERIVKITFHYSQPTPTIVAESRIKAAQYLSKRAARTLKTI